MISINSAGHLGLEPLMLSKVCSRKKYSLSCIVQFSLPYNLSLA
jgi:hypothetical protein